MKNVRNTLLGLYFNLLMVILLLFFLFKGMLEYKMGNWVQWTLAALLIVSGIFNVIFAVINITKTFIFFKNKDSDSIRGI